MSSVASIRSELRTKALAEALAVALDRRLEDAATAPSGSPLPTVVLNELKEWRRSGSLAHLSTTVGMGKLFEDAAEEVELNEPQRSKIRATLFGGKDVR